MATAAVCRVVLKPAGRDLVADRQLLTRVLKSAEMASSSTYCRRTAMTATQTPATDAATHVQSRLAGHVLAGHQ